MLAPIIDKKALSAVALNFAMMASSVHKSKRNSSYDS